MSSGSCNPVDRGCVCPVLKDALAKKYVPETGRKEYPVGLVEEMAVDPLPAGKGICLRASMISTPDSMRGESPVMTHLAFC